jgi:hypothetical protein
MKKHLLSILAFVAVIALVFTTFGDTKAEVFEEEGHHAAPAVAGILLEEAGIDNRYGTGKDGGNYISDVARNMAPDTDFNGVKKEDVVAYSCAVAKFLYDKGAAVTSPYSGVYDPISSSATATNNENGTVTLAITVKDLCGDGISGLDPLSDFYVTDSVMAGTFYFGTSSIPGSTNWNEADGVYSVTLERNYFNSRPAGYEDGWHRIWDIYVQGELVEDNLALYTTYYAVDDWKMDLYVGTTLNPRFIKITSHVDGDVVGFFGVGYDPDGVTTGDIVGTIEGQTINMHYSRTSGYTADFEGTINADGNSMSGLWSDYARTNEPWSMIRQ